MKKLHTKTIKWCKSASGFLRWERNTLLDLSLIKSPQIIDKIRQFEQKLLKLPNFFSEKDLELIESWMAQCRQTESPPISPSNWTAHPDTPLKNEMTSWFNSKISPQLHPPKGFRVEYDFAFHGNRSGYGIHTDAGYDPKEIIFQQGIIPLRTEPRESRVYTVIMNQQCFHSSGFPCVSEDRELQKHVLGLAFDDPTTQKQFASFWENSAFRKKQLNGFTIQYPFAWKRGDTVIWNRSYIHCSSDFEPSRTSYKEGLMWISRLTPMTQ